MYNFPMFQRGDGICELGNCPTKFQMMKITTSARSVSHEPLHPAARYRQGLRRAGPGGQNGTAYLSALCTAEQMIFDKYPAGQQDEAHRLAAAIKVNVKHPRRPSVATLLRQFDLNISEKLPFRRY